MFVVADEPAGGIGRERRLSRSGQPEEERRVAAHSDVRGAVHRQDVPRRHQRVHHRKDALLDLSGVLRSADQDDAEFEIDGYERARPEAQAFVAGSRELRHGHDREIGVRSGVIPGIPRDEKRPGEQRDPREVAEHLDPQAVFRVRACVSVEHEEIPPLKIRAGEVQQRIEHPGIHRRVHVAPEHAGARRVAHDEFVLRRTPRPLAEQGERAVGREGRFAASQRLLDKQRNGDIRSD